MTLATFRRMLVGPGGLAISFVVVHALVGVRAVQLDGLGDVPTYSRWAAQFFTTGRLVGVDSPWVYPVLAIVPMLVAGLAGTSHYLIAWVLLAVVADAIATVLLARQRLALGWWFVGFVLLLGPVTMIRIDEIVVPIAIAGVLVARDRSALAAVLLTLGAWIKVWPALLVIAMLVAGRRPARVVAAAAVTCAAVVGVAVALGARASLFSFVTAQATRGLQIEAPIAAPWLWAVAAKAPGARIYFDTNLLTYQVRGAGVGVASTLMTVVLAAGVLLVVALGIRARLRGTPAEEVLPFVALGLVCAVVGLNKVGSPQYLTWYAAPTLLGMLVLGRRFRFAAVLVPVMALLTQVIYPSAYRQVLLANPRLLVVLDLRDLLELLLLGWVVLRLIRPPSEREATVAPGAAVPRTAAG